MTRQDPGGASGRQVYAPRRVCTCGHGDGSHVLNGKGQRARCDSTAAGACGCRMFVDAKTVSG